MNHLPLLLPQPVFIIESEFEVTGTLVANQLKSGLGQKNLS